MQRPKTYVRMPFADYSSAFNTCSRQAGTWSLTTLGCLWITGFLNNRSQLVIICPARCSMLLSLYTRRLWREWPASNCWAAPFSLTLPGQHQTPGFLCKLKQAGLSSQLLVNFYRGKVVSMLCLIGMVAAWLRTEKTYPRWWELLRELCDVLSKIWTRCILAVIRWRPAVLQWIPPTETDCFCLFYPGRGTATSKNKEKENEAQLHAQRHESSLLRCSHTNTHTICIQRPGGLCLHLHFYDVPGSNFCSVHAHEPSPHIRKREAEYDAAYCVFMQIKISDTKIFSGHFLEHSAPGRAFLLTLSLDYLPLKVTWSC